MPQDSYSRIKINEEGKTLHIILSRPEKHNAFDEITIQELIRAFNDASKNERIRVIILRAEGNNFCAGADIEWMARARKFTQDENLEDALKLAEMIMTIFNTPKPVICRVHGGAFGGALGIVAACDIVVASDDATFALREVKLGIAPATISPILVRKMGESACRKVMLTGEKFSSAEAKEFGLVHKVVARDLLDVTLKEVISEILQNGPLALASCKELLKNVPLMSLEDAKEYTARMIASLRASDEGQEGLNAFLEKRKPRWTD